MDEIGRAFSAIYERNTWGAGSGVGSMREHVQPYVVMLQRFLRDYEIASVVDLGCGDWQFAQLIDWGGVQYLGLDVVEDVVEANRAKFATDSIDFDVARFGKPLPPADLVVCKDVLQHLPLAFVSHYLSEFRKRYEHVLVTNDVYPDEWTNVEIAAGAGRAIRPDLEPFCESCTLVLEWEISAFGNYYIKHTYYLSGEREGTRRPAPAPVEPVLLQAAQARDASSEP